MNKILFLTPMNPMGIGGGAFATHAYLRAFSELFDGKVDIVLADSWKEELDDRINIKETFKAMPMSIIQYVFSLFTFIIQRYSSVAKDILLKNPGEYSYVVSNGSSISGKLYGITKDLGIKLITIHHNYEPEYFAANSRGFHKYLYLPIVKRLERKAFMNSDYNLFLTEQDKEKFLAVYGENKKINSVIGVFEFNDYQHPSSSAQKGNELTFIITGSLCTMQGVDGIKYFFDELYQYLPANSYVIIAGRNPSDEVLRLVSTHPNVELIPNPVDMNKVISAGDIYICPTRVGGGLKLRVMDGLKMGLPVITHECSARGYDAFASTPYLKSFSDKKGFKTAVDEMLMQMKSIRKDDIISLYRNTFSYNSGKNRMKKMLFQ